MRTDASTGIRISVTATADSIAAGIVRITIPERDRDVCHIRAKILHRRDCKVTAMYMWEKFKM